jgi:hypothetical protein
LKTSHSCTREVYCFDYTPREATGSEQFEFGFEGCPGQIFGAPGEKKAITLFAVLSTRNNTADHGAAGWSFSLGAENLKILNASVE